MASRSRWWAAALVVAVAGVGGYASLFSARGPVAQVFRGPVSDATARVVIGPYPLEGDLWHLKNLHVTTVVSLLDPAVPYEKVLLDKEEAAGQKLGLRVVNVPMPNLLGRPFDSDYQARAQKAADVALAASGKVYIHCYLGRHRAKVVEKLVQAKALPVATYLLRRSERTSDAALVDKAQAAYDQRDFAGCLQVLSGAKDLGPRGQLLAAWATLRGGDPAGARSRFQALLADASVAAGAAKGVGYCALRGKDLPGAEQAFGQALALDGKDAEAHDGLALVRYRQGRRDEAAKEARLALAIAPDDPEATRLLGKLGQTP